MVGKNPWSVSKLSTFVIILEHVIWDSRDHYRKDCLARIFVLKGGFKIIRPQSRQIWLTKIRKKISGGYTTCIMTAANVHPNASNPSVV